MQFWITIIDVIRLAKGFIFMRAAILINKNVLYIHPDIQKITVICGLEVPQNARNMNQRQHRTRVDSRGIESQDRTKSN